MPANTRQELLETEIGNRLLQDWDLLWEPLPDAFTEKHSELRHTIGLVRVVLDGEIKYVFRATEQPGGIAKGLTRISGPRQTGNSGYGAQMIRKNIDRVKVDILNVGDGQNSSETAKALKIVMVKLHDPEWNWPHRRRMEKVRSGE